jgi:hypothetical protein
MFSRGPIPRSTTTPAYQYDDDQYYDDYPETSMHNMKLLLTISSVTERIVSISNLDYYKLHPTSSSKNRKDENSKPNR